MIHALRQGAHAKTFSTTYAASRPRLHLAESGD
jgi:hypothetical protein